MMNKKYKKNNKSNNKLTYVLLYVKVLAYSVIIYMSC